MKIEKNCMKEIRSKVIQNEKKSPTKNRVYYIRKYGVHYVKVESLNTINCYDKTDNCVNTFFI